MSTVAYILAGLVVLGGVLLALRAWFTEVEDLAQR